MKTDHTLCYNISVVNEFQKSKECGDESFMIPPNLFAICLKLNLNENIFRKSFTNSLRIIS